MKIAQVTPLYEAVPPKLYGGTERVVAHLTDALVDLGHDVTLFEKKEFIGGQITTASKAPQRDQIAGITRWFQLELARLLDLPG